MQNDLECDNPAAWLECGNIHAQCASKTWLLSRVSNLEELWDGMCDNNFQDERIPYWTELWPSSILLADWLYERRDEIRNQSCLDMGCGLGLTAIVGQWLGARVTAMDYELEALNYCKINASLNGAPAPLLTLMDWREAAFRPKIFSRVWAGDIIYERRFMQPVCDFFDWVTQENGLVWIAEPGRKIFEDFLSLADACGWRMKKVHVRKIKTALPQKTTLSVGIWELSRA